MATRERLPEVNVSVGPIFPRVPMKVKVVVESAKTGAADRRQTTNKINANLANFRVDRRLPANRIREQVLLPVKSSVAFLTFPQARRMLLPTRRTVVLVPQGRLT